MGAHRYSSTHVQIDVQRPVKRSYLCFFYTGTGGMFRIKQLFKENFAVA